ncbi:hypothetical protein [Vibrio lentus]|uniref:Uncharacterized protein n=1 Tax=Vibrio lentus TaxID=136468 RepID=A0A4U2EV02_9VIBR|nr:hypothetical protein [Vibrio lentus]PML09890.1 hypothetical protein BCT85_13500 [Vibrio lentus]TKG06200.1 hypothetical protein FCV91_17190 [Vibrio lentus]
MDPRTFIPTLYQVSTYSDDKQLVIYESLRLELNKFEVEGELRLAYLQAFGRGFPVDIVSKDSEVAFYAAYALRSLLSSSGFISEDKAIMEKLYRCISDQPVEEVIDIHVLWGKLFGLPASVRERLDDMTRVQTMNDPFFQQSRLDILNKIVIGESIEPEKLEVVVSGKDTKWDLLPWLSWQYQNLKRYISVSV